MQKVFGRKIKDQKFLKLSDEIAFEVTLEAKRGLYFFRIQQERFVGIRKILIE